MSFLDMVNGPPKVTVSNKRYIYRTKESSPYPDLLTETLGDLNENEIQYVIFKDNDTLKSASWDEFKTLAKDLYYDAGFGTQEISSHLMIVGKNWWMKRQEYDGSEWWEYNAMPKKPKKGIIKLEHIIRD